MLSLRPLRYAIFNNKTTGQSCCSGGVRVLEVYHYLTKTKNESITYPGALPLTGQMSAVSDLQTQQYHPNLWPKLKQIVGLSVWLCLYLGEYSSIFFIVTAACHCSVLSLHYLHHCGN